MSYYRTLTSCLIQRDAAVVGQRSFGIARSPLPPASSVADFRSKLHAKRRNTHEEVVVVAVGKLDAESRPVTGSTLEEEGADEVVDATVDSCSDECAPNK
jgi:hypothetical protein